MGGAKSARIWRSVGRGARRGLLDHIRQLIAAAAQAPEPAQQPMDKTVQAAPDAKPPCPCCGGRMRIIEVFARGESHRARIWIDSS